MRRIFLFLGILASLLSPIAFASAQTTDPRTVDQCISRATTAHDSCKQQVELQASLTCGSDETCKTNVRDSGNATCASRFTAARQDCYAQADDCTQQGQAVYHNCIVGDVSTTADPRYEACLDAIEGRLDDICEESDNESVCREESYIEEINNCNEMYSVMVSVANCETLRDQMIASCQATGATATSGTSPVDPATAAAQQAAAAAAANASQGAIARTYSQIIGDGQGSGQGLIFANICTSRTAPCECRDNGNCAISDILQVAVNIVNFIIAISGSLVLAMFIYGGVLWVFSAGNEGAVKKGRDIIEGAVWGLFIILGAYAAVAIIVSILTKDEATRGQNLEDITGGSQIFNTETQ